ncbi:MAG: decarboxylating NADP(+)-dependent phosphogluconate dehydrogenase [Erysipelotrichia bacterium]|nr:decarboxylating NADP(+)-dependent phosphogluconate dehydrogenase [Erysipelotrichia bacterium]
MKSYIGVYGLGVMGQSLALNIANHNYSVAVYNRSTDVTEKFAKDRIQSRKITPTYSVEQFINTLESPRKIILMVKAGAVTDAIIESIVPLLSAGDILIDCGNSYYKDTIRRNKSLLEKNIHFFGVGVSGGERGALEGPSIMPSGDEANYNLYLRDLFNVISAHTEDGSPCCDYIGPDGSGHYVKMVHNGIEYGDIQIICEAYQLLKSVLHLNNEEMADIFEKWNKGRLSSFLIEITAQILRRKDDLTDNYLVDMILDEAGQKGTGKWTSMEGLDSGIAIPTIAESVFARCLSAIKPQRVQASKQLPLPKQFEVEDKEKFIADLEEAVYASKITSYAQGFTLLAEASKENNWDLKLGNISLLWREGCIIRAQFLEKIKQAFDQDANLTNLLLAQQFKEEIINAEKGWRNVVVTAIQNGVYIPCITASLQYYDGYRSERLPANLLQAQRDWFGAHTYHRVDKPHDQSFHTQWEEF